jgi:hypothetical protein
LEKPTNHLIDFLIGQSNGIRRELKTYITEETRDDLVSLTSKPKGTIHKGIDKTDFLRHPFLKVSIIHYALSHFLSALGRCISNTLLPFLSTDDFVATNAGPASRS